MPLTFVPDLPMKTESGWVGWKEPMKGAGPEVIERGGRIVEGGPQRVRAAGQRRNSGPKRPLLAERMLVVPSGRNELEAAGRNRRYCVTNIDTVTLLTAEVTFDTTMANWSSQERESARELIIKPERGARRHRTGG